MEQLEVMNPLGMVKKVMPLPIVIIAAAESDRITTRFLVEAELRHTFSNKTFCKEYQLRMVLELCELTQSLGHH